MEPMIKSDCISKMTNQTVPTINSDTQSNRDTASTFSTLTSSISSSSTQPPTITITSSDEDKTIDGMLDRISHDLDYLLNRTAEIPSQVRTNNNQIVGDATSVQNISIPPPPQPPASNHPNLSVHEVIFEEAEE